jgi:hypothetical protein
MRLIAVTFGTILFILMMMGTAYFWGLGQVFPRFENGFFNHALPWTVLPWTFVSELRKNEELIVWADVSRDQQKVLNVGNQPLIEIFRQFPRHRFILNIVSNVDDIDQQVLEVTKSLQQEGRILFQSEYDVILRAMKDTYANAPYGSSQSDRMRFSVFESMAPWHAGLLPATPFRGDVFITPLKWKNVDLISDEIVRELKRRQKFLILGPLHSQEELRRAQSLGADGFYIDDASVFEAFKQWR